MSLFIKNIKKLIGVRQDAPLSPLKGKEMETLPCLERLSGRWTVRHRRV